MQEQIELAYEAAQVPLVARFYPHKHKAISRNLVEFQTQNPAKFQDLANFVDRAEKKKIVLARNLLFSMKIESCNLST